MKIVEFKNVTKFYQNGDQKIYANKNINFFINQGEFVIIVGPSGAGKSTTLNLLGGIDFVSEGEITVAGKKISSMNEKQLTLYRRKNTGFIFQGYNLIPNLTALENVEMSTSLVKNHRDPKQTLIDVGLGNRINNFPAQLSGGEQQRVAIARALAKNPDILLCDEPTGALDYKTGKQILKLLKNTTSQFNTTVIVVTHNTALVDMADRVIHIADATIREIKINENPQNIDEIVW